MIYYHLDESYELFNIKADIGETENLAAIETQKRKELTEVLADYLKSVAAQMPSHKESGERVAWTE